MHPVPTDPLPHPPPADADPLAPTPVEQRRRDEDGGSWPFLVWRLASPRRAIASAPIGGGLGDREWVLNAQVRSGYDRCDLDAHVAELAALAGLAGAGVGMLTAADVTGAVAGTDGDASVLATVGVRVPTWAAAPEGETDPVITADQARGGVPRPGTINIVVDLPAALSDAALVNLVATVTEAKTQALLDVGIAGTGTATDAVCILAARPGTGPVEPFGGPRSTWGARVARATYASVRAGITDSLGIIAGDAAEHDR